MQSNSETPELRSCSFRDPGGQLLVAGDKVIRGVNPGGRENLALFLDSATARKFQDSGNLIGSSILATAPNFDQGPEVASFADPDQIDTIVQHDHIWFPSYPYEWAPEMLYSAAAVTLDIAESLFEEGCGLKDATPSNVLFRGCTPIFIDALSWERRQPCDPIWLPYAQFVRNFLLPLLANQAFHVPLNQIFLGRRDGLEPEEIYRWCSLQQKLTPVFLSLVSIPTWLNRRGEKETVYRSRRVNAPEIARYVQRSAVHRLRKILHKLKPASRKTSRWSSYNEQCTHYSELAQDQKREFVARILSEGAARSVLDIGCNTSVFSTMAARSGARVVAIDLDEEVVGSMWREASSAGLDILPLVVNVCRPTPATGWRNRENASFLDRARGKFDCIFMLAVVHHLLVTEQVPLREILALAATLTTSSLVLEYVGPDDPMFRRLTRGRDYLFSALTLESFEESCRRHFRILKRERVADSNRWLYLLTK